MIEKIRKTLEKLNIPLSDDTAEYIGQRLEEVHLMMIATAVLETVPDRVAEASVDSVLVSAAVVSNQMAAAENDSRGMSLSILLAYYAGLRDGRDEKPLVDELFGAVSAPNPEEDVDDDNGHS